MTKQTALSVITFFILAFVLTFAISKLPSMRLSSVDVKDILCGFGPLMSGLVCYKIFKTPTTYSISGTQPLKSWIIVLTAAVTFMLTNTRNNFSFNLLFVATQLIYCFAEEFGWRHYLQSATNKTNRWLQPFIIGFIWLCWHFSWLPEPVKAMTGQNIPAPIPVVIISVFLALSLISFLFGLLMKRTHSILLPTILHFAVKANKATLAVALTLIIIADLTWNKLSIGKKLAA